MYRVRDSRLCNNYYRGSRPPGIQHTYVCLFHLFNTSRRTVLLLFSSGANIRTCAIQCRVVRVIFGNFAGDENTSELGICSVRHRVRAVEDVFMKKTREGFDRNLFHRRIVRRQYTSNISPRLPYRLTNS